MSDEMTFEALVEQRRKAWSAPTSAVSERFRPSPVAVEDSADEQAQLANLEDTMPLPRHRPERL